MSKIIDEEFLGNLRQKFIINSSNEKKKNLQHLTNELFKAAKADLRKEALTGEKIEITEGLDEFMKSFQKVIQPNSDLKIDKNSLNYRNLQKHYIELKQNLEDIRVLGVNKDLVKKVKTCTKNCFILSGRVLGFVAAGLSMGMAVAISATSFPADIFIKGAVFSMVAATSDKIGDTRNNLKDDLKNLVLDMSEKMSYQENTPKKLLETKKLWDKKGYSI